MSELAMFLAGLIAGVILVGTSNVAAVHKPKDGVGMYATFDGTVYQMTDIREPRP